MHAIVEPTKLEKVEVDFSKTGQDFARLNNDGALSVEPAKVEAAGVELPKTGPDVTWLNNGGTLSWVHKEKAILCAGNTRVDIHIMKPGLYRVSGSCVSKGDEPLDAVALLANLREAAPLLDKAGPEQGVFEFDVHGPAKDKISHSLLATEASGSLLVFREDNKTANQKFLEAFEKDAMTAVEDFLNPGNVKLLFVAAKPGAVLRNQDNAMVYIERHPGRFSPLDTPVKPYVPGPYTPYPACKS